MLKSEIKKRSFLFLKPFMENKILLFTASRVKKTKDKRNIEVNTKPRYPDPSGIVQLYFIHHFI
jgi:hypothetical protein